MFVLIDIFKFVLCIIYWHLHYMYNITVITYFYFLTLKIKKILSKVNFFAKFKIAKFVNVVFKKMLILKILKYY